MKIKTYKSYYFIKKLLSQNNILKATVAVPTIPRAVVPINHLTVRKNKQKQIVIRFETYDQTTDPCNHTDYLNLINYLKRATNNEFGVYTLHKKRGLASQKILINYVSGALQFPIHATKRSFVMNHHKLQIIQIMNKDNCKITLLCSKSLNPSWFTKFCTQNLKLSNSNLINLVSLLQFHLLNHISSIYIQDNGFDVQNFKAPTLVDYKKHRLFLSCLAYDYVIYLREISKMFLSYPINNAPSLNLIPKKYPKQKIIIYFSADNNSILRRIAHD